MVKWIKIRLLNVFNLKALIYIAGNIINLALLNILKITAAVNNILYTGSDYYIIITEIPVSFFEKFYGDFLSPNRDYYFSLIKEK